MWKSLNFHPQELFKLMVAYKSTKVDTGSVMDVMTEPELLEEWKAAMSPKAAFRTVLTLSPIDKANIAFTHPGKALSPDLIEAYCKGLQYSEKTIVSLTQLYQAGDLAAFRAAHHTALQEQEDAWWVALDKDVNEEMKKILGNRLHTPIPTSRGAESVDLSGITVRLTKGPMCATKSSSSQVPSSRAGKARTAEPARMRAVTSLDLLEKRWPLRQITAQAENKDFRVRATYSIAPCPIYKAKDAEVINPTDYRFQLVRDSLDEWSRYASIDFTLIAHPAETDARLDDIKHLTIVFQDYLYTTGIPIPLNDYLYQSYTYDKTQIPSPPLADDFEADEVEEYNREMKDFETCPPVKHTMCLRGIPNTADLGSQPAADIAQYVPGVVITTEMVARRTIMHEVGSSPQCCLDIHLTLSDLPDWSLAGT